MNLLTDPLNLFCFKIFMNLQTDPLNLFCFKIFMNLLTDPLNLFPRNEKTERKDYISIINIQINFSKRVSVNVISIDHPFIVDARFTTVLLKALSDQVRWDNHVYDFENYGFSTIVTYYRETREKLSELNTFQSTKPTLSSTFFNRQSF